MADLLFIRSRVDVSADADDNLAVLAGKEIGDLVIGPVMRVFAGEEKFLIHMGGEVDKPKKGKDAKDGEGKKDPGFFGKKISSLGLRV